MLDADDLCGLYARVRDTDLVRRLGGDLLPGDCDLGERDRTFKEFLFVLVLSDFL